jgi:hypothetical protein
MKHKYHKHVCPGCSKSFTCDMPKPAGQTCQEIHCQNCIGKV